MSKRRVVLLVAAVLVWGLVVWQVAQWFTGDAFERLFVDDFVEYWAAARLNLTGGNPYSPAQLLPLQGSIGWPEDEALIMWNPPWTLLFVMPFGVLPYSVGRLLWLILMFVIILVCSDKLWHFYGGKTQLRWLAWLVGITFLPAVWALRMGQITPLMLLGIVGILHFEKRRNFWLLGVVVVFLAIKPQLVYLFWIVFLIWILDRRRWRVLASGVFFGVGFTMAPLLYNPQVLSQYLETVGSYTPLYWTTPTFGALLRLIFGPEKVWLQFMPTLLGVSWLAYYWQQYRDTWDWAARIPLLLTVSVVTTSFGWSWDQVVLLPALIQMTIWIVEMPQATVSRVVAGMYVVLSSIALVMTRFLGASDFWLVWMAPALLAGYLMLRRHHSQVTANIPSVAMLQST